jgi:succinyl-diaminopimelate desuccinylase
MKHAIDPIELTKTLLQFNTINPPGHEGPCARYLGELLSASGFECNYCAVNGDDRLNLVASIGDPDKGLPLGFTGHIDTVPLGARAWQHDCFGASLEGSRLYGRGSSDMKSGVAAFVAAAISMADELKATRGVKLVITADEECGCGGALELIKHPMLLSDVGALIIGEPTDNYPLVGHKGALWLEAIARGITAHGSMPQEGDNAAYKAAAGISRLQEFAFDTPAHQLMGQPTLNVGYVHGGMNINSVPDEVRIGIDIRSVAGMSHQAVATQVSNTLGPDFEVSPLVDVESLYTAANHDWVQSVFGTMERLLGHAPQAKTVSYFTDGSILKSVYKSAPMVVLGPGSAHMAHQTDEYCQIDLLEQGHDAYRALIKAWID